MICQKKRKNIMDVNFEYYKIFYYVAKYHNFTKAAQALNNSQPNITRAMNCLEQQLNTTCGPNNGLTFCRPASSARTNGRWLSNC